MTLYLGPVVGVAIGSGLSTLLGQSLEKCTGTNDRSWEEILLNTTLSTGLGANAITIMYAKTSKQSGKSTSSDKPSWVNENMIDLKKPSSNNATDILNQKYGLGNWRKGPHIEYNIIIKWIERYLRFYKG